MSIKTHFESLSYRPRFHGNVPPWNIYNRAISKEEVFIFPMMYDTTLSCFVFDGGKHIFLDFFVWFGHPSTWFSNHLHNTHIFSVFTDILSGGWTKTMIVASICPILMQFSLRWSALVLGFIILQYFSCKLFYQGVI